MSQPYLMGTKIYLRALERSDLNENYLRWINDSEVTKYMETGTFPSNQERLEEYYQRMTTSSQHVIFAILDKASNRHIGNITLNRINWVHRSADLGIMIGEKDFWGQGHGTEATRLVVQYAFDRLNLHKLTLGLYAEHKAALRIYEKVGFEIEGCQKGELYRDGRYHDRLIMGITREKYYEDLRREQR